jgi:hypothetical protein
MTPEEEQVLQQEKSSLIARISEQEMTTRTGRCLASRHYQRGGHLNPRFFHRSFAFTLLYHIRASV